jgi:pimeloyl-ACP methyl ester carboxylesterase
LQRYYGQKPTWQGCGGGFDCADLVVPIDWSNPQGDTITLPLIKRPADGDAIGSLVINPGGPGVSGVEYARLAASRFGEALRRSYDIVSFDPRGVAPKGGVTCLSDRQLDGYVAADSTPDTAKELATSVAEITAFAQACEANTGPLLAHVDTVSVVRDMDVLRQALGDNTLTYKGASYGTYMGAWYAQTFPWRVGRMVLDGATDPSLTSEQFLDGQARGFQAALQAYANGCRSRPSCPLRGTVDDAVAQVGALVARADARPLTSGSGRPLTQSLMILGIAQALYADELWPALDLALRAALSGDGTALLALADYYVERDAKGHYGPVMAANPAMFCLDHPETRTPDQIAAAAELLGTKYPPLGATIGWGALTCAEWPIPAVLKPQRLTAGGAAPILVLGTVGDPATPYEWAQGLADQLSSGRLLTWEGEGHTAYGRGSSCIDTAVEAYLLAGTLPAEGRRCP